MHKVKILGIVGSPRKQANTSKLVQKALDGAGSVPSVETELYEMAGKKFHHCIACFKCLDKGGGCVFKDDFQDFIRRYMEADGIIWGSPVYHFSIPGSMKNVIDRMGHSTLCNWLSKGIEIPRLNKVCGTLTIGATRYGGQDFVNTFMIHSSLLMNCVVVSGDTILGNYIGAAGYTGGCSAEQMKSREVVLQDKEGMMCAENLGKRVAEMTHIVKEGITALERELPSEYFYNFEELL